MFKVQAARILPFRPLNLRSEKIKAKSLATPCNFVRGCADHDGVRAPLLHIKDHTHIQQGGAFVSFLLEGTTVAPQLLTVFSVSQDAKSTQRNAH